MVAGMMHTIAVARHNASRRTLSLSLSLSSWSSWSCSSPWSSWSPWSLSYSSSFGSFSNRVCRLPSPCRPLASIAAARTRNPVVPRPTSGCRFRFRSFSTRPFSKDFDFWLERNRFHQRIKFLPLAQAEEETEASFDTENVAVVFLAKNLSQVQEWGDRLANHNLVETKFFMHQVDYMTRFGMKLIPLPFGQDGNATIQDVLQPSLGTKVLSSWGKLPVSFVALHHCRNDPKKKEGEEEEDTPASSIVYSPAPKNSLSSCLHLINHESKNNQDTEDSTTTVLVVRLEDVLSASLQEKGSSENDDNDDHKQDDSDDYRDVLNLLLDSYQYHRYKKPKVDVGPPRSMVVLRPYPKSALLDQAKAVARATFLVRDLITTPAMDLSPATLQQVVHDMANLYEGSKVHTVVGDDLLSRGCEMIHAVGRASLGHTNHPDRFPRLIDFQWASSEDEDIPLLTLVGKGVTFDTGGLNLKPGNSMLLMKKDMGGAAHAIGLTSLLLDSLLRNNNNNNSEPPPFRLRLLVAAAENSMGPEAFRPGDILHNSDQRITTEIGNTDAEGRLLLGDALTLACSSEFKSPNLIVDFATLTGAARVALGTEIPAYFTNRDALAAQLDAACLEQEDALWRLPLWGGYRSGLDSKVATCRNIAEGGTGGAITAALYLQQFVRPEIPWIHVDLYGYNNKTGWGEAQGLQSVYHMIQKRFKIVAGTT